MLGNMIADMFGKKIQKDFIDGISKIAKANNTEIENVQIALKFGESEEHPVKYVKYINWEKQQEITYKQLMDIKIDFLQEEARITPIILNAMGQNAMNFEIMPENFFAFLYTDGKTIGVAIYNGSDKKRICNLMDLFSNEETELE